MNVEFIILLLRTSLYQKSMVDQIVLLLLLSIILTITTLEFLIIRKMRMEKQSKKIREELLEPNVEKVQECPHFLGYLGDHPKGKPVPDECFGCRKAMKCMNAYSTNTSSIEPQEHTVEG